jgi:hypothetical protein
MEAGDVYRLYGVWSDSFEPFVYAGEGALTGLAVALTVLTLGLFAARRLQALRFSLNLQFPLSLLVAVQMFHLYISSFGWGAGFLGGERSRQLAEVCWALNALALVNLQGILASTNIYMVDSYQSWRWGLILALQLLFLNLTMRVAEQALIERRHGK